MDMVCWVFCTCKNKCLSIRFIWLNRYCQYDFHELLNIWPFDLDLIVRLQLVYSVGTCLVIWSSCIKTNNSFEAFDNVILHIVKPNGCFTHLVQGDWSKKCKEALSKFELLKEGKSKDDIVYDKAVQVANYIGYQIEILSIYVPNNSYS